MSMDVATLEAELRSYGLSVEHVSVDDGIDLEYMTAFPGNRINDGEIGRACNTLIDMIEADELEPRDVDATVVRAPGDPLGTWHAAAAWFEQLTNYEISETEFSTRVLETVEHEDSKEHDEDTAADSAANGTADTAADSAEQDDERTGDSNAVDGASDS